METATSKLLTRDEFRQKCLERDNHKCVFYDSTKNIVVHHIMERRLFADGGYYVSNGASVCEEHHFACEETTLSVEDVRIACGITKPVIPEHLYPDQEYDKWGNPIMPNGMRLKGELFHDESVQKVLEKGKMLHLFSHWVKYNRTYHVPWSENMNKDDRMMPSTDNFVSKRVIVTEKMDGENTNMYRDHFHTRSLDSRNHPSRNWAKQFWATISADIPEHFRVCGENLYAKHSIHYNDLPTYFMGFSMWDDKNMCLSWDQTLEWFSLIGITPVPVLYDGVYDEKAIRALWNAKNRDSTEGYVIRIADAFPYAAFKTSVGKFVRKNHVQCHAHWMHQSIEKNLLKQET
jgi:hypothetical protein